MGIYYPLRLYKLLTKQTEYGSEGTDQRYYQADKRSGTRTCDQED